MASVDSVIPQPKADKNVQTEPQPIQLSSNQEIPPLPSNLMAEAACYMIENEPLKAARVLFDHLYSNEEVQEHCLRDHNLSSEKQNIILRTLSWLKDTSKLPYSFNYEEVERHSDVYQLEKEEEKEIRLKIFVNRRNQRNQVRN